MHVHERTGEDNAGNPQYQLYYAVREANPTTSPGGTYFSSSKLYRANAANGSAALGPAPGLLYHVTVHGLRAMNRKMQGAMKHWIATRAPLALVLFKALGWRDALGGIGR